MYEYDGCMIIVKDPLLDMLLLCGLVASAYIATLPWHSRRIVCFPL